MRSVTQKTGEALNLKTLPTVVNIKEREYPIWFKKTKICLSNGKRTDKTEVVIKATVKVKTIKGTFSDI